MATLRERGRAGNWFYSGDPAFSTKDWVRFAVGDTDSRDQLIGDEEIAALLASEGSKQYAAVKVAERIAAGFAKEADMTIGDGTGSRTKQLSQRVAAYMSLAKTLRSEAGLSVYAYAGGISVADKDTITNTTDRPSPTFYEGMMDNK